MSKVKRKPLPRPRLPCHCIYLMRGTQEPDPRDATLKKVDWDGPVGVAATVEMDGKEYHMALSDIVPLSQEVADLVGYLRHWIVTEHDAKTAAADVREKLWKKSLLAILDSEQGK